MEQKKWWLWSIFAIAATGTGCAFGFTPPGQESDAEVSDGSVQSDESDGIGEVEAAVVILPDTPSPESSPQEGEDTEAAEVATTKDTTVTEPDFHQDSNGVDATPDFHQDSKDVDAHDDADTMKDDGPSTGSGDIDTADANTETETAPICVPQCENKECGENSCGGSCGECPIDYVCNADFLCECVVGCTLPPPEEKPDVVEAVDVVEDTPSTSSGDIVENTDVAVAEPDFHQDSKDVTDDVLDQSDGSDKSDQSDSGGAEEIEVAVVAPLDVVPPPDSHQDSIVSPLDSSPQGEDAEVAEVATAEDTAVAEPDFHQDSKDITADVTDITVVAPPDVIPSPDAQILPDIPSVPDVQTAPDIAIEPDFHQDSSGSPPDSSPQGEDIEVVETTTAEDITVAEPDFHQDSKDVDAGDADTETETTPICVPQCEYKECGENACGGSCGTCPEGFTCNPTGQCDNPCDDMICNDLNPCTNNTCDPVNGCQFTPNTLPCSDNNACTTADTCQNKECQGGPAPDCNDKNICTDDWCDQIQGCQHKPNSNFCDDNTVCTILDICQDGKCKGTSPLDCDDEKPCTLDVCHPIMGCQHSKLTGTPCNDNNACTTVDTCQNGACVGTTPPNCDDSNKCTLDSCDKITGCQHVDTSANCKDGNLCTDDACDPAQGCVFFNNTKPCNDNNACTLSDTCSNGACLGANPKTCQDFNPCTDDTCDPVNSCQFTANSLSCNDNNQCTNSDTCGNGTCKGANKANGATCDDGKNCNTSDSCQSGACQGKPYLEANFDDGVLPVDWSVTSSGTTINIMGTEGATSAPYAFVPDGYIGTAWAILKTTTFNLANQHTGQLSFDHKFNYNSQTFKVTLDKATGESVELLNLQANIPYDWKHYSLDLSAYSGTYHIRFHFTGQSPQPLDTIKVGCP